jgi:hypothetical protein
MLGVNRLRGASPAETTSSVPSEPLVGALGDAQTCIFCGRQTRSVEYLWPEWLCQLFTDQLAVWTKADGSDDAVTQRLRSEIDQTVDCVCDTCRHSWMQRLDDDVRTTLTAMIVGDATTLTPEQQRLLARWAAKTAVLMELAYESPNRTPPFVCEHLRRAELHPGTQVLIGKYDGNLQILTHERDLFSTTIDATKHYLSQSTFVIGKVLIQVFADPWKNRAPELADDSSAMLLPLTSTHDRTLNWPPRTSIDDVDYDLVRLGSSTAPRDVEPSVSEDQFDDLGRRDSDDDIIDLLVGDAADTVALARWKDRLRQYVEQQGPLDALRLRSPSEPPWPAPGNPMVGYLIERCTEMATEDGFHAAVTWLATNAWFEGVISERARIARLIDAN